jgi:hypothetical protein
VSEPKSDNAVAGVPAADVTSEGAGR